MRDMKDSGVEWIGKIPAHWDTLKLKYCVDCLDNERIPIDSAKRVDGPYPYWGAGSITDYVNDYIFDEDLVLLGEDGAPFFDPLRDVAHHINGKCWINNHIHVLRSKDKVIVNSFLTYWLNSVDYKMYINGSILNKLTQSNMMRINVFTPSLEEQKSIASFLDTKCAEIDSISKDIRKEIETLQEYRKFVITEAVTKGLDPNAEMKDSGSRYFPYIPKEWELTVLKYQVCSIETGTSLVCSQNATENGYGILKTSSVTSSVFLPNENKELSDQDISKVSVHVKKNAILVNRKNTPELVGSCAFSNCDYPNLFIPDLIWQVLIKNRMRPKYVYYFLSSSISRQYYGSLATGSSMSMSNISISDFLSIKLPKPPLDVQERIATFLDYSCSEIESILADKQKQLDTLAEYRKSLIYEYVTGKKEVPTT